LSLGAVYLSLFSRLVARFTTKRTISIDASELNVHRRLEASFPGLRETGGHFKQCTIGDHERRRAKPHRSTEPSDTRRDDCRDSGQNAKFAKAPRRAVNLHRSMNTKPDRLQDVFVFVMNLSTMCNPQRLAVSSPTCVVQIESSGRHMIGPAALTHVLHLVRQSLSVPVLV
jgi:hypothetical protein